jgi:hypothetical protein
MGRPILLNDSRHWRDRAEEARAIAQHLRGPITKQTMLEIAHGYDRLAQRAEERQKLRVAHGAGTLGKPSY